MTFEDEVIQKTVDKLIKGQDYRDEVIKSINALFLDFAVDFFKKIAFAKTMRKTLHYRGIKNIL